MQVLCGGRTGLNSWFISRNWRQPEATGRQPEAEDLRQVLKNRTSPLQKLLSVVLDVEH